MDNSSTTLYLLRAIARDLRVSIITNSLKLLLEAVRIGNPNLQFICLGGELKESNMSFSGAIPQRIARDDSHHGVHVLHEHQRGPEARRLQRR